MSDSFTAQALAEMRREHISYRPSIAPIDLARILAGNVPEDIRRVSIGRLLYVDLPDAVKRWTKGYGKAARDDIRTEALLYLARAERDKDIPHAARLEAMRRFPSAQDRARRVVFYIGRVEELEAAPGFGSMPLRREWLERDEHGRTILTIEARARMAQAVRYGARHFTPSNADIPTDDSALLARLQQGAALADIAAEQEGSDLLPADVDAHELGTYMGLPLQAARAMVYRALEMTDPQAAELWGIVPDRVRRVVSDGAAILKSRYPEARDLTAAMRDALTAMRIAREDGAYESLKWLGRYPTDGALRSEADEAVALWASVVRPIDPGSAIGRSRALELSARAALKRHGAEDSDLALRIARSAERLLPAEGRRERRRMAAQGVGTAPTRTLPIWGDSQVSVPAWGRETDHERTLRIGAYGDRFPADALPPHRPLKVDVSRRRTDEDHAAERVARAAQREAV